MKLITQTKRMVSPTLTKDVYTESTGYIVLIAARNEAKVIEATIRSARDLSPAPENIIVVVNNTTDETAVVATKAGALVVVMAENHDKKAGALNHGLELLSTGSLAVKLTDHHAVLVMDADTVVESRFARIALEELNSNQYSGGVSSIFQGRDTTSLLGYLQQMEYFRYGGDIKRNGGEAFVLSGTAAMIRWTALKVIKTERQSGQLIPGGESYYDTKSLTEDNELTFALKSLGWDCPAPGVKSTTDVMETARTLYAQRHRWYIGALGNIQHYGTKMPFYMRWVYWRQQLGLL